MAISQVQAYNTFVAGLITEAGPLTFPENASFDEDNCLLFKTGKRRRRLGVDYESSYVLSTQNPLIAVVRDKALSEGVWTSVAGTGTRNFLVLQVDGTVYFYDLSVDPISNGQKSFTITLSTYAASGATDIGSERISMDSGKGLLFITSKKIEPIRVEYDPAGDSITVTQTTLQIRDFAGVDDGLAVDNEPSTLSTLHSYNLKNQGWQAPGTGVDDPTTTYFDAKGVYPGNNKQWWVGKDVDDNFDADLLAKFDTGSSPAPKGRFLLNPFYKDRDAASGTSGITVESEDNRPEFVAFFSGRAWYMGVDSSSVNGHVFFSQVVTEAAKAGNCYQQSDPTGEDLSELLDNDGGVIVVPEIGTIRGTVVTERALIIFASNGVWTIGGTTNSGFKATDFEITKMGSTQTSIGSIGNGTIVETEGFPVWWSETGIYTLGVDQVSGKLFPKSLTDKTIKERYQDIPALSKANAKSIYDPASKRIYFMYSNTAPSNDEYRYKYDRVMIFESEFGAFVPWSISSISSDSPWIFGAFNTSAVAATTRTEQLADGDGDLLINGSSNTVVADVETISGNDTFIKFLCMVPDGSTGFNWTMADFNNGDFVDWETADGTGANYSSFITSGYEMGGTPLEKQAPLIIVFCEKTETAVSAGALVNPSSLFMQMRYDWTDDGDSNKWSEKKQVYRLKEEFDATLRTDIDVGQTVITSKNQFNGQGRAAQFHFESENGKDFIILGWVVFWDGNFTV